MKLRTIRGKLIFIILILGIFPMILLGGISVKMLSTISEREYLENLENTTESSDRLINAIYNGYEDSLSQITANSILKTAINSEDKEHIYKELEGIINSNNKILNAYIATEKGDMLIFPTVDLPEGYNPRVKSWYKTTKSQNKETLWQDAYEDIATGKTVVTATKSIYDNNGNFVGVAGIDIDISNIADIFKTTKIGKKGDIYLLDRTGIIIASKNPDVLGKNLNPNRVKSNEDIKEEEIENLYTNKEEVNWMKEVMDGKKDLHRGKILNTDKYIYYMTNKKSGWKLVGHIDKSEVFSDTMDIIKIFGLIAFAIIIIAGIVAGTMSRKITKSLEKLKSAMISAEKGEFNIIRNIKTDDEIEELANSFNIMIKNISELIKDVKNSSNIVFKSSNSLSEITEQTADATDEVASSIEQIASSAGDQARDMDKGIQEINILSKTIEKVTYSTDNMNLIANETNNLSSKGLDTVHLLNERSKANNQSSKKINEIILEVDKSSNEISTITETISQISEQTNLLALNAAIEAARAGEHGKGFSVVAEEVRKLAEQSSLAAKRVKELIYGIQYKSQSAVKAMDEGKIIINEQNMALKETNHIFNEITHSIEKLIDYVKEVRDYTIEIDSKKDGITNIMSNLAAISQETSASSQQVSAAGEEQMASIQEVSNHAKSLRDLAANLERLINKFKLN